ncbi:MAG: hypothetical protein GY869_10570, partial [Planctomycetes bacterium]|nr:hypothetical protein [Planctomycetota bacterium]
MQVVKVDPTNPNIIWAGTTEGTYKSTDAGETWTCVHDVIMTTDLVINPQNTDMIVIGCGSFSSEGYGIYRTTDGGINWTKSTEGLPETYIGKIRLSIYEADPEIIFASIGNGFEVFGQNIPDTSTWLCRSTDSGESWTIVSTENYAAWQGWYSHDVAVNPADPDEVITAGIFAWKSETGGTDLEQISIFEPYGGEIPPGDPMGGPLHMFGDFHVVLYHPTNSDIVYFASDGGVYRSVDGAQTFEGCNGGYQTTQFYSGFACSPQDSSLAIGGMQDSGTIIYNGSVAWNRHTL